MAQTAVRAGDLLGTFGINTHIDYTDGKYASVSETLKALDYLGIHQVREHGPNTASDPNGQTHLGQAAAAGLRFVFNASASVDPLVAVQRIHDFVQAHPGAVTGIEGLNEVNNWPVTYHGQTGAAGAVAYQKAFFDALNADPLLKDIPVIGFTGYTTASASDLTNIHTYAKDGDQPFAWLAREAAAQKAADPGKALVVTETGYHTSLTADTAGGWEGVDPATQAKLTLNTLMDAAVLGSKQTFLYELFDAYADPQGSNQEKHFGLFNLDSSPKPAATALHNLTALLADPAADAKTFAPDALNLTTTGLSANGHSYLTEKAGGAFQILVWDEPDIWNQAADTAIQAPAKPVTVDLGATFASVTVYDPLLGTAPVKTFANVASLTIDVVDHPIVIDVAGIASSAPLARIAAPTFSDAGYLASNPDVAKAGVVSLAHYQTSGWKEGRDPSAAFDTQLYLAHNPDVRAAGIDPLAHYLQHGQAEGRQAYAAIGSAQQLQAHPGFDAEYYLLANADVAKAALASGGDTFAFAYQHYETSGWHEGRNPNAIFDTGGYLSAYGDVAAARTDPLAHYETYGFREGRDPSAGFDTKSYGAAYADVKAAGIDPMLHFLQYGAGEGRFVFSDGHFA